MFFMGTYTPKLDEKGRLFLPAKFRDQLGEGLVVTRGQERCLTVWPMAEFMELTRRAQEAPVTVKGARDYTRFFAQVFGLSEAIRARMQALIEAREGVLMANFEPRAVGGRIHVPTLVVHDRGDRINPFAHGEAFVQAIAGARLVATDGLGHRKILYTPPVVRCASAYLLRQQQILSFSRSAPKTMSR